MTNKKKFKISYGLFSFLFYISLFLAVVLGPIFPIIVPLIGAIIALWYLKKKGRLIPFRLVKDGLLIFGATALFLVLLIGVNAFAFAALPWGKLILASLLADLILFLSGWFPIVGDILGGIIAFLIVWGITGSIILASTSLLIALIPGPIPLVTIGFIILKIALGSLI